MPVNANNKCTDQSLAGDPDSGQEARCSPEGRLTDEALLSSRDGTDTKSSGRRGWRNYWSGAIRYYVYHYFSCNRSSGGLVCAMSASRTKRCEFDPIFKQRFAEVFLQPSVPSSEHNFFHFQSHSIAQATFKNKAHSLAVNDLTTCHHKKNWGDKISQDSDQVMGFSLNKIKSIAFDDFRG